MVQEKALIELGFGLDPGDGAGDASDMPDNVIDWENEAAIARRLRDELAAEAEE